MSDRLLRAHTSDLAWLASLRTLDYNTCMGLVRSCPVYRSLSMQAHRSARPLSSSACPYLIRSMQPIVGIRLNGVS